MVSKFTKLKTHARRTVNLHSKTPEDGPGQGGGQGLSRVGDPRGRWAWERGGVRSLCTEPHTGEDLQGAAHNQERIHSHRAGERR